jgi:hypothetical protein
MAGYEFKGGNDYSQEVLADVQRNLTKAIKALNEIDHNFAFVKGCDLEYKTVQSCEQLLRCVSDNLYCENNGATK